MRRAERGAEGSGEVKGEEGTVKVHKSEDGDLEQERKGAGEEGESKM